MTTQTKHIITAAVLILLAAFFSLGRVYEKHKPCNHDKPYEVKETAQEALC